MAKYTSFPTPQLMALVVTGKLYTDEKMRTHKKNTKQATLRRRTHCPQ